MNILGISCFYHDSAAALICDGKVVAAAQEERFTRKKHDQEFPSQAVEYCLREANLTVQDIDAVAFYDKPFLKFERILETYLAFAPRGFSQFIKAIPTWIKQKLWIKELIKKKLNYEGSILFPEHHLSHAASAFYPSPFDSAAVLTMDGVGEWATTSFGVGNGNKIELRQEVEFPHSLGLLYSAVTYYLGFKVNSAEYKVMGLAPYGEPRFIDVFKEHLIDIKNDGSFHLNMEYFTYATGLRMTGRKFSTLFGRPRRLPESNLEQFHMDVACSLQKVTEEVVLKIARYVRGSTKEKYLCLAGGVALNSVANGKLQRAKIFDDIWIQPAAGDAGGALGAALAVCHEYYGARRENLKGNSMQHGSLLGPSFSNKEICKTLEENEIGYKRIDSNRIASYVAALINKGNIVGWFQGRMEFGPRALGSRSILGDPRNSEMQKRMNLKIKFRESFRPFAPSILEERAGDYFEITTPSPYMLVVAPVKVSRRKQLSEQDTQIKGLAQLDLVRSDIPAVTHVDYSARVQTVGAEANPRYRELLQTMEREYGCPLVVNTSFNIRGEPIVCTPEDAIRCFQKTNMDYLVMGDFVVKRLTDSGDFDSVSPPQEFGLD